MIKTLAQAAALALSTLMTLGTVADVNSLATAQYAKADSLEMARYGQARQSCLQSAICLTRSAMS